MIALRARRCRIALALFACLLPRAGGAEEPPALSLSIEASLPDYACLGLSLERGDTRARIALNADEWGGAFVLPWLAVGALEPAGLAAFIQRPQGLSYRLGRYAARPFSAPAPLEAPLLGAVAGGEGGCFIMDAKAQGLPSWSGAWLSPRGLPLSALSAWAALPREGGDGSWNEPPSPAGERSWHAFGGGLRLGPLRSALGAGAMLSSPGEDAWALRLENLLLHRAFKIESVAALSLGSWRGPADSVAPALFVDAMLSAQAGELALSLDYDETRDEWGSPALRKLALGGETRAGAATLEGSLAASFLGAAPAHELELRWKASLTKAPPLAAYGSWALTRSEAGLLEHESLTPDRLEFGCSLKAGKAHALALDAAWRADRAGRFLKLACAYAFKLPRASLLVYLKTDGWFCYEPEGLASVSGALTEAGLRYSQTYP